MRTFTVPGRPAVKGRPRFGNGRTFTPKATLEAEERVLAHYLHAFSELAPFDGPVHLECVFVFEHPKGWRKSKIARLMAGVLAPFLGRPDLDNLLKLVLDALNEWAYRDDSLVYSFRAMKRYGAESSTHITLLLMPEEEGG